MSSINLSSHISALGESEVLLSSSSSILERYKDPVACICTKTGIIVINAKINAGQKYRNQMTAVYLSKTLNSWFYDTTHALHQSSSTPFENTLQHLRTNTSRLALRRFGRLVFLDGSTTGWEDSKANKINYFRIELVMFSDNTPFPQITTSAPLYHITNKARLNQDLNWCSSQ